MAGISGYADQKKNSNGKQEFVTVSPVRAQQHALDAVAHMSVQSIGSDAVESGSTATVINATAHAAIRGDVISFTSGNLDTLEVKVKEVTANTITLVEELSEAPAASDTFDILRHKYLKVASDGGISTTPGPTQYKLDGSDTIVTEDTGTPANNTPLPVKLLNASGDLIGQQAMADSIPVAIASDQGAIDIGNITGTVSLPTGAATSAKQDTGNTSLSSIDGKMAALGQAAMAASMPVAIASDQSALDIGNISGTVSLPTGAATSAKQDTGNTSLATIAAVDFATETTLAAQSAKLPATLGQKTAANSMSVVLASDQTAIPSPTGRSYADSARNDYSSVNVTTSAWVELITSTAGDINLLYVFDSSGQTLELGVGGSGSEARKLIIPPGGCDGGIPLHIASGSRISVKAISATASSGEINIVGLN